MEIDREEENGAHQSGGAAALAKSLVDRSMFVYLRNVRTRTRIEGVHSLGKAAILFNGLDMISIV